MERTSVLAKLVQRRSLGGLSFPSGAQLPIKAIWVSINTIKNRAPPKANVIITGRGTILLGMDRLHWEENAAAAVELLWSRPRDAALHHATIAGATSERRSNAIGLFSSTVISRRK
jgi:hypothetical protein